MDHYFGTEAQIRLQQKNDASIDWCRTTKGAVLAGRFLGSDDPDAMGWDVVLERIREDGAFTFRMIPIDQIEHIEHRLGENGFRIDFWNVFSAPAKRVLEHVTLVAESSPLPEGYDLVDESEFSNGYIVRKIQECMARNGVVPFSGLMLTGQLAKSHLVAIRNSNGGVVAAAYGYFPYNQYSPYHSTVWGGLVAVDEDQRGKRLGVIANALMAEACVTRLNAEFLQEFVAKTNIPSRKMVERCGLVLDETVMSGIAVMEGERFTK